MDFRTDLAIERSEILDEASSKLVNKTEYTKSNVTVTRMDIDNEETSKLLGKPQGTYITVQIKPLKKDSEILDEKVDIIADELNSLLPKHGTILVAGLGNEDITPDALGPKSMDLILSTRHIKGEVARSIGLENLRSVAGIIPGVLGKTGIESGEIIKGVSKAINPCAVIIIDALAARNLNRLGNTVQISNTGIIPGSGVGNSRRGIDSSLVGTQVISIGIPTVVDAQTLASDLLNDDSLLKNISPQAKTMMVTPREIDIMIERASRLVAMSINRALQTDMEIEDILSLVT